MKNKAFKLRVVACLLWALVGILSFSFLGILTTIASLMFLTAMIIEKP